MKRHLLILAIYSSIAGSALAAEGGMIADFENNPPLKPYGAIAAELVTDKDHVKEGATALKLTIDYGAGIGRLGFKIPAEMKVSKETGKLSMWVFGDGSDATVAFNLEANDKGLFSIVKPMKWEGWQEVVIPMADFTVNVHSTTTPPEASKVLDPGNLKTFLIIVYKGISSVADTRTLYIDSIKLVP